MGIIQTENGLGVSEQGSVGRDAKAIAIVSN